MNIRHLICLPVVLVILAQLGCGTTTAVHAQTSSGMVYRGNYSASAQYNLNDSVTYQGSSYIALAGNLNVLPVGAPQSTQDWAVIAAAGATGAAGPAGPMGPLGVTGATGAVGPVGAMGPAGPTGATGPAGPAGAAVTSPDIGSTATNVALEDVVFGANNAIPTGDNDTVYGVNAGASLTSAREMTIFGAQACQSFTGAPAASGVENGLSTCIGSQAAKYLVANGAFPSIDDVFIGQKSAINISAAQAETVIGVHSGTDLATGQGRCHRRRAHHGRRILHRQLRRKHSHRCRCDGRPRR